jgi:hypothetical protein
MNKKVAMLGSLASSISQDYENDEFTLAPGECGADQSSD